MQKSVPPKHPTTSRHSRLPRVAVCGVGDLSHRKKEHFTHIISIWDSGARGHMEEIQTRMASYFPRAIVHYAFFDDVERATDGTLSPCRDRLGEILAFAAEAGTDARLLIHCFAGISRSTAVAFAVLCQAAGAGHERAVFELLKRIRPQLVPNRLISHMADCLLERDGAMQRIVEAHWKTLAASLVLFPEADDDEEPVQLAAG